MSAARVILKPRKALPFYGRHPWVLASAIDRIEPTGTSSQQPPDLNGQLVELHNEKRKFIAYGIYNSHSRIAVRLYSWSAEEPFDDVFIRRRLEAAITLRQHLGYQPVGQAPTQSESATRLVFSEADGLSGLVVDRYGDYLVVQPTALGIVQRLESIVAILQDLLQPRGIILKFDKAMAKLEGFEAAAQQSETNSPEQSTQPSVTAQIADGHIWGTLPDAPIIIRENNLAYEVDLRVGQKTGFYLDQRENRLAAARYLRGRRVLDMFCYTGG